MNPLTKSGPRFWRDLILATSLIAVAMFTAFFRPPGMSVDAGMRLLGVLMGVMMAIYANEIPKRIPSVTRCDPARQQALRRFIGWTMVLGGVGYAVAWLVAPIRMAPFAAILFLGGALAVVLARITFVRSRS